MKASEFLRKGADLLEERGKQYDQPGGERSMGKAVNAFNAITGRDLTEPEGWLLLQVLKDVRQWQNPDKYHADSAEDCVSYAALKAEALSESQCQANYCEPMSFGSAPETPLPIRDGVTSDPMGKPGWDDAPEWAMWMAQDADGWWNFYSEKPRPLGTEFSPPLTDKWWRANNNECRFQRGPNPNWRETLEPRPLSPPEELEWQTAPDQATHLLMNGKQRMFAIQDGGVYRDCDTQYVIDMADWPIVVGR